MGSSREDRWSVKVLARKGQDGVGKTLTLTDEQYREFCRFLERFSDGGGAPPVRASSAADQPTKVICRGN
jgi:hypothetical protein